MSSCYREYISSDVNMAIQTSGPKSPKLAAYDVVIIGGATSGSAVAFYLASNPDFQGSILVVERDPSLAQSATKASNNCMRQQFATEINVRIAQYAAEFVKNFRDQLKLSEGHQPPDLPIRNFGYLYLSNHADFTDVLRRDQQLQAECGAGTQMLSTSELGQQYPFYNLSDIEAGSLNTQDEGAFDAWSMVQWLAKSAQVKGVEYVENEVVSMTTVGEAIKRVKLRTGEDLKVGKVVNAAGTKAAHVAAMAGAKYVPIEARRRYTYIFTAETPLAQDLPLTIDPTGVHIRSYGNKDYLVGCPPIGPDVAVDADDFSFAEDVWEQKMKPVIQHRIPGLGELIVTDRWIGHYEFNTFDHNAILGPHDKISNLLFCCGFSGHGSQQGPACGRGISELIIYDEFKTLDLSPLLYKRIPNQQPLLERAVI